MGQSGSLASFATLFRHGTLTRLTLVHCLICTAHARRPLSAQFVSQTWPSLPWARSRTLSGILAQSSFHSFQLIFETTPRIRHLLLGVAISISTSCSSSSDASRSNTRSAQQLLQPRSQRSSLRHHECSSISSSVGWSHLNSGSGASVLAHVVWVIMASFRHCSLLNSASWSIS